MELLMRDEDIVSIILEFLHSRNLCRSAVTLERETGVLRTADRHLPDHLQYLRSLCIRGDWDNVFYALEPFTELAEFNTKKANYLILKQEMTEVMHHMLATKTSVIKDEEMLEKLRKEIQAYCSTEELEGIHKLCESFANETRSLLTFRVQCFYDLVEILAPFFEVHTISIGSPWTYQKENTRNRLESVVADSLFLNECHQYCKDRALKPNSDLSGLPNLSTKMLENRGTDMSGRASVMFWIRSLNHDNLFRQRFDAEDVMIKTAAIVKQKLLRDSSFFTNPANSELPSFSPTRLEAKLTPSTLSCNPHVSSRNFSNNNNNNAAVIEVKEEAPSSVRMVPNSQSNASGKITPEQVVDSPVGSEHSHSSRHSKNKHDTNAALCSSTEKTLKNPSSTAANTEVLIKLQDSYEKFVVEKKRQQAETEAFLRNLEKKEKRKQEVREFLLQYPAESNDRLFPPDHPAHILKMNRSVEGNDFKVDECALTPLSRSKYKCIEYTKDVQAIRAVTFHPSGQVYAIGSSSKLLRICKVPREVATSQFVDETSLGVRKDPSPKTSEVVAKKTNLHKGSIYCAAWNDEGSLIATGSNDKLIKLVGFDILAKTLEETPAQMSLCRGIVRDVTFMHESNNTLASASGDGMVSIADCKYNKLIHKLAGHTDQVLGLYSWHHDLLASASQDKCARLWDVRTPSCASIVDVGGQDSCFPTNLCVDKSGRWLAMGLNNAEIAIYDLSAGKMALNYRCHSDEVRCLRFNPVQKNLLVSSSYDCTAIVTDLDEMLNKGDQKSTCQHWKKVADATDKLIQCKWHQNGNAFAITSANQICGLWNRIPS